MDDILIPREQWRPFPTGAERPAWQNLPRAVREAHVSQGERALTYDWAPLPATLFLDFARTGNRNTYESFRNERRDKLADLVLAECMEGEGRFIDAIVNGIWATCEETYWGVPAHLGLQKAGKGVPDVAEPTVDLFAAETSALLAWTHYLLAPQLEKISPLIPERIRLEVDRRILTPNLEREDFWWMGFADRRVNNWNPWINSNWLTAVLLLEENDERRISAAHKILRSLDNFLNGYPADGGCDEGPSYWGRAGGSLFDCLELLYSATNGALDIYDDPLVHNIGRYIYRVHIDEDYFINFADASARLNVAADLVFRYGRRIGDQQMMVFGAFAAAQQDVGKRAGSGSIGRQLPALFNLSDLRAVEPAEPLLRDVWLPHIQVMVARSSGGSSDGLYLAAKGGHNAESHNHNDVGNFIVYVDGRPALIDAGVGTYTAQTFSSQRYEIWTMQSAYHNLPTIDGVMQKNGPEFAARDVSYHANDAIAELSMDIAGAYPAEAGVQEWKRRLRLERGKQIEVMETYLLSNPASELSLTLMTPCQVTLVAPGKLTLKTTSSGAGKPSTLALQYDPEKLSAGTEEIPLEDNRLKGVWGNHLTRILLQAENPPAHHTLLLRITEID